MDVSSGVSPKIQLGFGLSAKAKVRICLLLVALAWAGVLIFMQLATRDESQSVNYTGGSQRERLQQIWEEYVKSVDPNP